MKGSEVVSTSARSFGRPLAVEAVNLCVAIRLSMCELHAISLIGCMSRCKDAISFCTHKPQAFPQA
jgi:hypothetical protein